MYYAVEKNSKNERKKIKELCLAIISLAIKSTFLFCF